jgi:hypothetical protein
MANLRRLRFSILLGLSISSISIVYAQAPAADCQVQNNCPAAQSGLITPEVPQIRSTTPPRVTYRDGRLTITAYKSTLGDVLRAVSTETGAVIEFPVDRAQDPFSAQAGPGPIRDVLATLFNGSRFNYVMLGAQDNPGVLERMIVTTAEAPAQVASAQPPPVPAPQIAPPAPRVKPQEPPVQIPPDDSLLTPPKEQLSPEGIGELMKEKAREIRERVRQQQPPQQ